MFIESIRDRLRQENALFLFCCGGLLAAVLSYAILTLPWLVPVGMLVGIFGTLFFFGRPTIALTILFTARILLDLMWWVPGSIMGLGLLALFSGGVSALAAILFLVEFRRLERTPSLGAFLIFSLILGINCIQDGQLSTILELSTRLISPPLMLFLIGTFVCRRADIKRLMLFILFASAVAVSVSLYHLVTGQMNQLTLAGYNRLLGGYKNLRNHGMMMMLIVTFAVFWWHQAKSMRMKGLFIGLAVASLSCMYLSYIRTAILALVGFIISYLYFTGQRRLLAGVVLMGSLGLFLSPEMQSRFEDLILVFTISDDPLTNANKLGSGRWGLWTASFWAYLDQPVGRIFLGAGVGNHWELTRLAYNPFVEVQGGQVDTHNDYLYLLYQLGPISLACYLYMQTQVIRIGALLARHARDPFYRHLGGLAASLSVAAIITNSISNGFVSRTTLGWLFWGIAGLAMAAWRDVQNTPPERSQPALL